MTFVFGPIQRPAMFSGPTPMILSPRTASACAVCAVAPILTILPLRRTRSAGCANRELASAESRKIRMKTSLLNQVSGKAVAMRPERTLRADLAIGIIDALFVRTTDD